MSRHVSYDSLSSPGSSASQRDILDLFDGGLRLARRQVPSIALCCRTQFKRPYLLRRALDSFTIAILEAGKDLRLQVSLVSDCGDDVAGPYLEQIRTEFPALDVAYWQHEIRPPRHSRTDLLLHAIERAETDYVWFVDDDDYVLPGAGSALARSITYGDHSIVVGNSLQVEEVWTITDGSEEFLLASSKMVGRFDQRNVLRIFSGANHIAICSFLLPVNATRAALADKRALGNYYEDYFLLLAALTAPGANLRLLDIDLAGVSFRGEENTVNATDRALWNASYVTFLQEILSGTGSNPMLWGLGKSSGR